MIRGLYTAASGMLSQQRLVDMYTNNISNAQTPGYKGEQASVRSFPEMLMRAYGTQAIPNTGGIETNKKIGALNTAAYVQELAPNFEMGALKQTGLSTDVALIEGNTNGGATFFTVQDASGNTRYTKNGHFQLDSQGNLTTAEGFKVLGTDGQPIVVQGSMQVSPEGFVYDNGQQVGQLNIAFAENPLDLKKEGNNLFFLDGNATLPNANNTAGVTYSLSQGMLESSNVDLGQETTNYLTAYRAFEANQKVLQAMDKSLDLAANSIGKV